MSALQFTGVIVALVVAAVAVLTLVAPGVFGRRGDGLRSRWVTGVSTSVVPPADGTRRSGHLCVEVDADREMCAGPDLGGRDPPERAPRCGAAWYRSTPMTRVPGRTGGTPGSRPHRCRDAGRARGKRRGSWS